MINIIIFGTGGKKGIYYYIGYHILDSVFLMGWNRTRRRRENEKENNLYFINDDFYSDCVIRGAVDEETVSLWYYASLFHGNIY